MAASFLTPSRAITTVRAMLHKYVQCLTVAVLTMTAVGCAAPASTLDLVDYRDSAGARRFSVDFEEGFCAVDPRGNLDVVQRHSTDRDTPGGPAITQVVHLRTVWRSIPGLTVANETQINGTAVYAIVGGAASSTYEGAGSLYFVHDPVTGRIRGRLNRVVLLPKREVAAGEPVFQRVELSGTFDVEHDPRRTVQAINDLERLFGPRLTQSH